MDQYEEMRSEALAWDQPPAMPLTIKEQLQRLLSNVARYISLRFL